MNANKRPGTTKGSHGSKPPQDAGAFTKSKASELATPLADDPPQIGETHPPSQLGRLIKSVLESLGYVGATAQSKVFNFASRQLIGNLTSGQTQTLTEANFEVVRKVLIELIRERRYGSHSDVGGDHVSIIVDPKCEPMAAQNRLRHCLERPAVPQRHLYDTAEAAKLWEDSNSDSDRSRMIAGLVECVRKWRYDADETGKRRPPLAEVLPIQFVALGSGTGKKEIAVLNAFLDVGELSDARLLLVDSSLSLLTGAARAVASQHTTIEVTALCADFEGNAPKFVNSHWAVGDHAKGTRLLMMFGNVFGNLIDESHFVSTVLPKLMRSGDYLWIEVGTAAADASQDPAEERSKPYPIPGPQVTSNLDRLLVLPYLRGRRLDAHRHEDYFELHLKVGGPAVVPGSYNWRYFINIQSGAKPRTDKPAGQALPREEGSGPRRTTTVDVLYARRYALDGLVPWLEKNNLKTVGVHSVPLPDSKWVSGVTHLLLRYDPPKGTPPSVR